MQFANPEGPTFSSEFGGVLAALGPAGH